MAGRHPEVQASSTYLGHEQAHAETGPPTLRRAVHICPKLFVLFWAAPERTIEARAEHLHHVLGLPANAMSLGTLAHWSRNGGFKVRTVFASTRAAAARVATRHYRFLCEMRALLIPAVEAFGHAPRWAHGEVSPKHWGSRAIIEFLLPKVEDRSSYFGPLRLPSPPIPRRSAMEKREDLCAEVGRELLGEPGMQESRRLQAHLVARITARLLPDDSATLIAKRASSCAADAAPADIAAALAMVRTPRVFEATTAAHIWRAWCGGWTTTHRFHKATVLPCLFGCASGIDKLEHYLSCPRLWIIVKRATSNPEPGSTPLERLALSSLTAKAREHAARQLAVATSLYQAVALDVDLSQLSARARASRDLRELAHRLLQVAIDRAFTHGGHRGFARPN